MYPDEWKIDYYLDKNGAAPFREWFESLRDVKVQAILDARLARLRLGNFGHCDPVDAGVLELKIYYGPGYRIYFGQLAGRIVLLLCGGDKSTQRKDIREAHRYWLRYREKNK